jgi:UDP-glucose 4-epimerase
VDLPGSFDALVHCAAEIPDLCADPEKLYRSNVMAAERLFATAEKASARTIVNLSSMSVYGRISVPEVFEDLPPDSPDSYGLSKIEAEHRLEHVCASASAISGLSIRLPGTVGRGSHHNFLSNVMVHILDDQPVTARNPDALFNNVVYVEDLAAFITRWIEEPSVGYRVTNIASREPIPMREVIESLYRIAGRSSRLSFVPGGKPSFLISLDRALSLGYRPPTVRESLAAFAGDVMGAAGAESGIVPRNDVAQVPPPVR